MRTALTVGALLVLAACTSDEPGDTTEIPIPPVRDSGGGPNPEDDPFEPAAVGFEYWGGIGAAGEMLPGKQDYGEPVLVLRFGSELYFDVSDDYTQALNSCEMLIALDPPPLQNQLPVQNRNDAQIWQSYEFALTTVPENARWGHTCGAPYAEDEDGFPDPKNWGDTGEILIDKFLGAHVVIAFSEMTDYLRDAFTDFDGLEQEQKDATFAMYIAINDKNGQFIAEDWTVGYAFQWDEKTGEVFAENGSLIWNVAEPNGDGWLASSYVRSFAYWYQDFPLMNLDNLKDGAPTP